MPFYDVGATSVFITTENTALGLAFIAGGVEASIAALKTDEGAGVNKLGTALPGTADLYGEYPAQITDVTSMGYTPERVTEDLSVFDKNKMDIKFTHSKSAEITISRLMTHTGFKKLYGSAPYGVGGSAVVSANIYNGMTRYDDSYGFRLVFMKGDGTFDIFYHCKFASDGHSESTEKDSVQVEELKFVTKYYELGRPTVNVAAYPRSLFAGTPPSL